MAVIRFVCISDTHNRHEEVARDSFAAPGSELAARSVLVHCGDLTDDATAQEALAGLGFLQKASEHFAHTLFLPGNHDGPAFTHKAALAALRRMHPGVTILVNESVTLQPWGIVVSGNSSIPWFTRDREVFGFKSGSETLRYNLKKEIANNTQILLSHSPPYNIRDLNQYGEHIGCTVLAERIRELRDLRLHVFGHVHSNKVNIHPNHGITEIDGITRVNATSFAPDGKSLVAPIVVEVDVE